MADPQQNPFLVQGDTSSAAAAAGANPFMLEPGTGQDVGAGEDLLRNAGPSALRAGVGFATTVPSIMDLAGRSVAYGLENNPIEALRPKKSLSSLITGPETPPEMQDVPGVGVVGGDMKPPTFGNVMGEVEKKTGKLYEPKTWAGRIEDRAIGAVPFLASGPGGWITKGLSAIGSGAGSEAAVQAAKAAGAGPVGQGVADFIGGAGGALTPSGIARHVVPPISPLRQADASLLKEAGVDLNAARATDRPALLQRQANLGPKGELDAANRQFSTGMANKVGIKAEPDGRISSQALNDAGKAINTQRDALLGSTTIGGPVFTNLTTKELPALRSEAFRVIGNKGIGPVDDMIKDIAHGAMGSPLVAGIPGPRYMELRKNLQSAADGSSGAAKEAFLAMKTKLDDAMENSLPAGGARDFFRKAANFDVIKNSQLGAEEILTPKKLGDAIKYHWGEGAYNADRGLTPYAKAGERVLTPLPAQTEASGMLSKGAAGGIGMILPKELGMNPLESGTMGILSLMAAEPTIGKMLYRNPVNKAAYNNPMTQALLKTQTNPYGMSDVPTILGLLAGKNTPDFVNKLQTPLQLQYQSPSQ